MAFLYRSAVTVSRKQPYLDWANGFDDDGPELTGELAGSRRTVYLVGESDHRLDLHALLDDHWEDIFEEELSMWMEEEDDWPAPRTREMFDAWFDAEITDTVIDLVPDEPLTQTDVELADSRRSVATLRVVRPGDREERGPLRRLQAGGWDRFADRAGLTVPLRIDDECILLGAMTPDTSQEAQDGEDLVVPCVQQPLREGDSQGRAESVEEVR